MKHIVAFNWPKLVLGAGVALGTAAAAAALDGHWHVRLALLAIAIASAYLVVSSLAVSWWVFDRSDLHEWSWLRPSFVLRSQPDPRWALVHAGFEEAGPGLPAVFGTPAAIIDISSRLTRISPSLRRARRQTGPAAPAGVISDCAQLPMRSGGLDAIVLIFAAHEVRDAAQRHDLFVELRRALAPGGRVILVEHLRDAANIAAFGPGAWHFQSRRTWATVARRAGFNVGGELRMTPFVKGWALCPS